jgi:hypothetical protein
MYIKLKKTPPLQNAATKIEETKAREATVKVLIPGTEPSEDLVLVSTV